MITNKYPDSVVQGELYWVETSFKGCYINIPVRVESLPNDKGKFEVSHLSDRTCFFVALSDVFSRIIEKY